MSHTTSLILAKLVTKIKATSYKNSAEVDIAPASGKITKNVKYRSRAPGSGVF